MIRSRARTPSSQNATSTRALAGDEEEAVQVGVRRASLVELLVHKESSLDEACAPIAGHHQALQEGGGGPDLWTAQRNGQEHAEQHSPVVPRGVQDDHPAIGIRSSHHLAKRMPFAGQPVQFGIEPRPDRPQLAVEVSDGLAGLTQVFALHDQMREAGRPFPRGDLGEKDGPALLAGDPHAAREKAIRDPQNAARVQEIPDPHAPGFHAHRHSEFSTTYRSVSQSALLAVTIQTTSS
jgi:hypothetical protein